MKPELAVIHPVRSPRVSMVKAPSRSRRATVAYIPKPPVSLLVLRYRSPSHQTDIEMRAPCDFGSFPSSWSVSRFATRGHSLIAVSTLLFRITTHWQILCAFFRLDGSCRTCVVARRCGERRCGEVCVGDYDRCWYPLTSLSPHISIFIVQ